jgi:hypothetical protein
MKQWAIAAGLCAALNRGFAADRPACLSPQEAHTQIGKKQCVSGKVLAVKQASDGVTFLDFCPESKICPFTAVLFPADSDYVGDVNQLVGQTIEIRGKIQEHDGRAEIVLRDADQLHGGPKTPPTPTEFDVEKRGKFGAGTFHAAKARKASRKRSAPPTGTVDVGNPDSPD